MKKILPLLLVLAAAFLVAACQQSRHIPSPQSAANDFLQKISERRFPEAYYTASFAFRAQTEFHIFQATAKELGLSTGTISCNWLNEEITAQEAKLTGELLAGNGTRVPVRITLIREGRAWKVFALYTPDQRGKREEDPFSLLGKGGSFNSSANHDLPSPRNLQKLTLRSLQLLDTAVQQNNFEEFYSNVSLTWQNQLTLTQLREAFQPFIDSKANFDGIEKLQPVFDVPPEINTDGILSLEGHYNTQPHRITFSLRFIYEFPNWKLYGIKVQIQD